MKILVLDNYDSFTYNLVQYIEEILDEDIDVYRNDKISLEEVDAYDTIILSPGPGLPSDAGIMPQLIQKYAASKNILGICLGHQAIAEAFGGQLLNLSTVFHGIATDISITAKDVIFEGIPAQIKVGRYHSWVVKEEGFPKDLEIIALDDANEIMALRHKTYNIKGLQFHPESIMTKEGKQILRNFLEATKN